MERQGLSETSDNGGSDVAHQTPSFRPETPLRIPNKNHIIGTCGHQKNFTQIG